MVDGMYCDHDKSSNLPPVLATSLNPDIFTRLDAKIAERTRISNAGLHERMQAEERTLENYKSYRMKRHTEEVERIRLDLKRLSKCSPGLDPITLRPMFEERRLADKGNRVDAKRGDTKLCQRCYIHHTPYKDIYYQNWWLKNLATQREFFRHKFGQKCDYTQHTHLY